MHLYCLKTLLTIHFIIILSSICFSLSYFCRHIFFSSLSPCFSFFTSSKRIHGYILDALFIPFIYIYNYLHFLTLHEKCPHTEFFLVHVWTLFTSGIYTHLFNSYLHLLIHTYVLFILLCKFYKVDKIWEI